MPLRPMINAVYQKTLKRLEAAGVPQPAADAHWLLQHVLKSTHWRLADGLTPAQQQELEALVERRCRREPLQYILGTAPFGSLLLEVTPDVLIPRPETEELLEAIPAHLPGKVARFLDLGTGSGALALGLAQLYPQAQGVAVDNCPKAVALAQKNAQRFHLHNRITFHLGNWFEGLQGPFDLIVANPPYLTQQEWTQALPEVRDFEPKGALVAANHGLADLETLVLQAPAFLSPGGCLVLETGLGQHPRLHALARGYARTFSTEDIHGCTRFFWGVKGQGDKSPCIPYR